MSELLGVGPVERRRSADALSPVRFFAPTSQSKAILRIRNPFIHGGSYRIGEFMVSPQTLAKSIVRNSLRPKADEVVLISTYPHTIDLAEQAALECQKAGADPAIFLTTDDIFYGQFKNYSVEGLRHVSGHCVGPLDYVNSYIWFFGPKDPSPMAKVPREKFAAMF
jgi:hypothetical protein